MVEVILKSLLKHGTSFNWNCPNDWGTTVITTDYENSCNKYEPP